MSRVRKIVGSILGLVKPETITLAFVISAKHVAFVISAKHVALRSKNTDWLTRRWDAVCE